ncbi:zinc-dependent metalloprotease family protein, partial [Pseudokineococcus basanitobsidens]
MDRSTATTRAARAGACALLAGALLPLPTAHASTDDPAQAVLAGRVVEVVVEHEPSPAEPGHASDEHHHDDAPAGLQLDDGTTVGVEGLAASGAVSGEEVRLVVDVPAALEDAVAEAAGERRLDAARERPAAEGSALAEAVVTAAAGEGVTLAAADGTVRTTAEAPPPATAAAVGPARPVTVVVADMGEGTERVPTDADLASMVQRASDYWSDQSTGRVTFALAGTPTRYSTSLTCTDVWALWEEAKQQAGFAGGRRAHLVVVLLDEGGKGCGYGVGSVGSGVDAGGVSALDNAADLSLVAHELGHNLSFAHANSLECVTAPRQDVEGTVADPCRVHEYGDLVDVMAASTGTLPGALSATARARGGFLEAGERATVTAVGTTSVELAPLAGAPGSGAKDVSVTDPRTGAVYRLENRQAADRDADRLMGATGPVPQGAG